MAFRPARAFNHDFQAAYTEEQQRSGVVRYDFRSQDVSASLKVGKETLWLAEIAAGVGTDWPTQTREAAYARGLDALWGMYQWLDRAPKGRNETAVWYRRHDEYGEDDRSRGGRGAAAASPGSRPSVREAPRRYLRGH
jgi:predicted dithiol-disulfide oxidoreductase (DUF899 family)